MLNRQIRALVLTIAAIGFLAVPIERGAAQTTLTVQMACNSLGYADGYSRVECFGYASGGSGNYYYDWTPNPDPLHDDGFDYTVIRCARAYIYQTVYLTVTDLDTGATGNSSRKVWCGGAP
ncbi:MAG TPA: hypothetical protein VEY11_05525 [Pyrinomonadaceae bacterium]|nr:hypothetical protein [Pyrinomonadaceae bacterium]